MAWLKRLAAPKWWPIDRKIRKFVAVPRGPHKTEASLPLVILIRDILKLAQNSTEAESIIKKGEVLVDGRKQKDPNFGIGILDVIDIPTIKKSFRTVPSSDGLKFIEISDSDKKLCKIVGKKNLNGNRFQLNFIDGRNLISKENSYLTHDSLLIELPGQKVLDHLEFKKGNIALVIAGKNSGIIAKIKDIQKDKVWIGVEKAVEVPKNYLMIVGKEKPLVKLE